MQKVLKYIGLGRDGLFSNRVKIDEKNKTIQEIGGDNNLNAKEYYNTLQPVSLVINKISQDASKILIELQDSKGVTIKDNNILNKFYYFLENKYGQNGISSSYQDLITQIVANLKLNNEYFLRIFYNNIEDVILGIEIVPPSLCIETINNIDGYIDEFEVLLHAKNRNVSQIFKRIKERKFIKKTSIYKHYPQKKDLKESAIDTYLIHYHTTNGIEIDNFNEKSNKYDFLPQLRGVSNVNLIKKSLDLYEHLENAILFLTRTSEVKRNTLYISSQDSTKLEELQTNFVLNGNHLSLITNHQKNSDKSADNATWITKNIDVQKDLIHYYNMRVQEAQSIGQYFGLPRRIISTEGSAYNNLAIATDEYERNLLAIMSNITHFLTNIISIISPNFMNNNYKFIINKSSSFLIKKEIKENIEIEKEFSSVNEIREQYFDKLPIQGGEYIAGKNKKEVQLTPDEAKKQKKKMPYTGDRTVKKTT